MKFLLTAHQFFPEFSAGTEVLTRSVARELIARGHQVHVFTGFPTQQTLQDHQRLDEYDLDTIHVYRFHHAYTPMGGQTSSVALGYDNHLAVHYFQEVLRRFGPDIVHFFHLNRLGTGLIDAAVAAGIPAFFTPTDFWAVCPTARLALPGGEQCSGPGVNAANCIKHFAQSATAARGGFSSKVVQALPAPAVGVLVRLSRAGLLPRHRLHHEIQAMGNRLGTNVARLNRLTRIVAPNRFMRDALVAQGVLPDKIVEASYGIEPAAGAGQPRPARRLASPSAVGMPPLRVAFIGTLGEFKGCHILIQAFLRLPADLATLQIFGSPHDFPAYAASLQAQAQGHPNITFGGVFPNESIDQVLSEVDVLVVPSLWFENTPLVVYSAQAAQCVVVGSRYAGIEAAVRHDVDGLLFEPGDITALANQLRRLAQDRALLQRLRAAAPQPKPTAQYVDELLATWGQPA